MKKCGRTTEVYSRVTGYFRPLRNWNAGKREEFRNRLLFTGAESGAEAPLEPVPASDPADRMAVDTEACVCS